MLHSIKLFFMLRIRNYFLNNDKIFIIHINIIYSNKNEMSIDFCSQMRKYDIIFLKIKISFFIFFYHQNMHIYRILFCLKEKKEYFFKNIVIFLI